jgi:amidase
MDADTWKYDSTVVSLSWQNLSHKEGFRIGLLEDDGVDIPSPPVRRGLREAAELLRRSGQVELVLLVLPNVRDYLDNQVQYCTLSGSDVR